MDYSEPLELVQSGMSGSRRPRVLLAASGSVAAIKFESLCRIFSEWAEVRAVATKAAQHFIDIPSLNRDIVIYTDYDEWSTWSKIGDAVLHIELRKWADLMVIAPCQPTPSPRKPMFVAPAMNTLMWNNPFTERHIGVISELGIKLISPVTKRLACGDSGKGAMAEPTDINNTIRLAFPHEYWNMSTRCSRQGRSTVLPREYQSTFTLSAQPLSGSFCEIKIIFAICEPDE